MIWIRLGISCIVFLSIAGSISFGMIELAKSRLHIENPILLLTLQKLAFVLYWLPIPFLGACMPRISYGHGEFSFNGEFLCSTGSMPKVIFQILGLIWIAGFLLSAVISGVRRQRLFKLRKGNVLVMHQQYADIFEEYRKMYHMEHVALFQNDLICSPITVGLIKSQIILPFADYTEKELRMIYEHELTHICNRDLYWRMIGLVTSWIHWFNPVIYVQHKELACQQEIVCDLSIALENISFTKKEYAIFLARLTDNEIFNVYALTLKQNKKQTIRRIETMAKVKTWNKPKKQIISLSCACLAMLTLIPSTVAAAKTADAQENWMRTEEVLSETADGDHSDSSVEHHGYADASVIEIYEDNGIMPYSSVTDISTTIKANTRHIWQYRSMEKGDSISIAAKCNDSGATYWIGIKNQDTSEVTYVSGTGKLSHDFTIDKDGKYAVFVENRSDETITVTGSATYFD